MGGCERRIQKQAFPSVLRLERLEGNLYFFRSFSIYGEAHTYHPLRESFKMCSFMFSFFNLACYTEGQGQDGSCRDDQQQMG